MGHQDYFLAPFPGSIVLFISQLGSDYVLCNSFIMVKPREKVPIFPSTTRRGTTLNTSAALDSPSVMSKLLTPPHPNATVTSAESENSSNNFDDSCGCHQSVPNVMVYLSAQEGPMKITRRIRT